MKSGTFDHRLDRLLNEDVLHAKTRAETSYDLACGGIGEKIVLFGAGGFGRSINRKLRDLGIQPIAFADNNPILWGKNFEGTEILSPLEAASRYGRSAIFLVSIWNGEATDRMGDRARQLKSLGCQIVLPFGFVFWKYHEAFLPHFCLDLPDRVLSQKNLIRAAMLLWSDEASQEEYVAQVDFRTTMNFDSIDQTVEGRHYFPPDLFSLSKDEVFIDCGAFDGDTIADFVLETGGRFKQLVAFEPDPVTFPILLEQVQRLSGDLRARIQLSEKAIGRKPGTISFESTGTMLSTAGSGTSVVPVNDLDSALASIDPTFIKLDIEGFELEALMGASGVLSRTRPILAVSAYHSQNHLWRIPLLLSSLLPDRYQFFLRPHGAESWDLVCYAVPEERALTRSVTE